MVETAYAAGLRISELAAARLADLDLGRGELRVTGKGRKERVTLLGGPAREALDAYLREGRPKLHGAGASAAESGVIFLNSQGRAARRARPALPARSADARRRRCRRDRPRTRCATRSPATCSRAAPTCASSRSCSATPAWARPRSTPTSRPARLRSAYRAAHPRSPAERRYVLAVTAARHSGARRPDRRRRLLPVARPGLGAPRGHHQHVRRRRRAGRLLRRVPAARRDLPAGRGRRPVARR